MFKFTYCIAVFIAILLLMMLSSVTVSAGANDPPVKSSDENKVSLHIAVIMNTNPTMIEFLLRNNSKEPFSTSEVMTNGSVIMIQQPSGIVKEAVINIDGAKKMVILPGKTMAWTVDISTILETWTTAVPGRYLVYWKIKTMTSNQIDLILPQPKP